MGTVRTSLPRTPKYLRHRGADGKVRARVRIGGRDHYLGEYGSPESRERYKTLIAQWAKGTVDSQAAPIISEAVTAYLAHLRPKVNETEYCHQRQALRPLDKLFSDLPADQFGPKRFRACMEWLATEGGYVRRLVNRYARRIRWLFSWLVREERIPATITHALAEVPGLRAGECGVREHKSEVLPVPPADLWKTLRKLSGRHRTMVRLQVRTGMRPGELCRIRAEDVQRTGRVEIVRGVWLDLGKCWLYRPKKHKTEHRGHRRFVLIGPRAQMDLAPWLVEHAGRAGCFAVSKTVYDVSSYHRTIQRACDRAGVQRWHPHQLRHNAASRIAAEFGWEVARIVLGHRTFDATKVYVLDDLSKATEAMGRAG